MSNPSVTHDPENVRTDDHPAAPRASETGGPMAQGTRIYDRHQEDSERASERAEAVSWWVETARAAIAKLETTTTTTEQLFSHDLETYRERVIAGEVEEDLFDGTTMLNVIKDADTACGEVRHALAMILDTLSRSTTETR